MELSIISGENWKGYNKFARAFGISFIRWTCWHRASPSKDFSMIYTSMCLHKDTSMFMVSLFSTYSGKLKCLSPWKSEISVLVELMCNTFNSMIWLSPVPPTYICKISQEFDGLKGGVTGEWLGHKDLIWN